MNLDQLLAQSREQTKLGRYVKAYVEAQTQPDQVVAKPDLSMRQLAMCMPNITLMEVHSDQNVVYRIAGDNVIARLGMNPTGHNFMDLIPPGERVATATANRYCLTHPCGIYLVYDNDYSSGRRMVSESLILPLRKSTDEPANLLLGLHIHHEASGFSPIPGETRLLANLRTASYVDIGAGLPGAEFANPMSVASAVA
ncbi:MAG: PAS domain-containing protein [Parvibaculum sp.]